MAKSFPFEIVTPEARFYKGDAEIVIVKTTSGEEGFMANHVWGVKLLAGGAGAAGELRFKEPGGSERAATIEGGFIDVKDRILVFTDSAAWAE
ncbi:MAG: F0F1 ATP synthase subunit delta [Clostridiales Family XIII bacterium]|jgi:F-type H+-transporting ATPase subunit epsilon|nr:F0F1 ATP synthase subunit delta [Clostridiales Family XIII bacterium]